jgi:hypothetical protein
MLTYTRTFNVPGRPVLRQTLDLRVPLFPLTTWAGVPTVQTLNRFSTACHATAACVLVGGLVAISVVAHSDLSAGAKAGICVGSGLVMLGSYYCCKLSGKYALSGSTLDQFIPKSAMDANDVIDDFEEGIAF